MAIVKKIIKQLCPNIVGIWHLIIHRRNVNKRIKDSKRLDEIEYSAYLERFYETKTKHHLNLDNPQRYTEKLQWRKIYDRHDIYSWLSDKYRVRKWVEEKIGSEYLVPLLDHWKQFDEIDFDKLPDQFVLKTNNGCHANIIVKNKQEFMRSKWSAKKLMQYWLKSNEYLDGLELHYANITPEIIAEKYMEPGKGEDCLTDYKFHCFCGEPFVCEVIRGRTSQETIDIYDMEWKHLPISLPPYPNTESNKECPPNYNLMIEIARKLSQGFQYVRVDLYNTDKVYFGEMTFTPTNGVDIFVPDEWDYKLGKLWNIHTEQVNESIVIGEKKIAHKDIYTH